MTTEQKLPQRAARPSSQGRSDEERPVVIIVDDDASVREALSELLLSAGFQAIDFASTRELLDADMLDRPRCLILDASQRSSHKEIYSVESPQALTGWRAVRIE